MTRREGTQQEQPCLRRRRRETCVGCLTPDLPAPAECVEWAVGTDEWEEDGWNSFWHEVSGWAVFGGVSSPPIDEQTLPITLSIQKLHLNLKSQVEKLLLESDVAGRLRQCSEVLPRAT